MLSEGEPDAESPLQCGSPGRLWLFLPRPLSRIHTKQIMEPVAGLATLRGSGDLKELRVEQAIDEVLGNAQRDVQESGTSPCGEVGSVDEGEPAEQAPCRRGRPS